MAKVSASADDSVLWCSMASYEQDRVTLLTMGGEGVTASEYINRLAGLLISKGVISQEEHDGMLTAARAASTNAIAECLEEDLRAPLAALGEDLDEWRQKR